MAARVEVRWKKTNGTKEEKQRKKEEMMKAAGHAQSTWGSLLGCAAVPLHPTECGKKRVRRKTARAEAGTPHRLTGVHMCSTSTSTSLSQSTEYYQTAASNSIACHRLIKPPITHITFTSHYGLHYGLHYITGIMPIKTDKLRHVPAVICLSMHKTAL